MKAYFLLQFSLLNRRMSDFGLHPVAGYILGPAGFIALSAYLFYQTALAEYLCLMSAFSAVMPLSETRRNDFLQHCFGRRDYLKIRLLENALVAAPFVLFLLYKTAFPMAVATLAAAVWPVFFSFSAPLELTLPTPFSRRPFEFAVGFRSSLLLIVFAGFLAFMAIWVNNFNLGVFALVLVFLVSLGFYARPENEFYVWSFGMSPRRFLWYKISVALVHATLLSLPLVVALGACFFAHIGVLLLFQLAGYAALLTIILAKYASYPDPMNIPQAILVALCIQVPPVILVVAPVFYLQSLKRLRPVLS
jgi:hypothetical protein